MDRDRVVSYLAAMTDDEFNALQADARAQPHPLAQVRASVAAKAAQLAAQPRTASGYRPPTTPESAGAENPAPEPQPEPEPPGFTPNRGQAFAGNSAAPPAQPQSVKQSIADQLSRFFERTQNQ